MNILKASAESNLDDTTRQKAAACWSHCKVGVKETHEHRFTLLLGLMSAGRRAVRVSQRVAARRSFERRPNDAVSLLHLAYNHHDARRRR